MQTNLYSYIEQNIDKYLPKSYHSIDLSNLDRGILGNRCYRRLINLYILYFKLKEESYKTQDILFKATISQISPLYICCHKIIYDKFIIDLEFLEDFTWEKLNTGNWKDVEVPWRVLYAHTLLLKFMIHYLLILPFKTIIPISIGEEIKNHLPPIKYHFESNIDFQHCHQLLIWCDKAILMGSPPFITHGSNIFTILASKLTRYITTAQGYVDSILNNDDHENLSELSFTKINFPTVSFPMESFTEPSLEYFQNEVMAGGLPVVLKEILTDWPCYNREISTGYTDNLGTKWDISYLLERCGPRLVPVEIGSRYTDANWFQELMPFWKFVKNFVLKAPGTAPRGYLAQHCLFDQIPELREDFAIPLYCSCSPKSNAMEMDLETEDRSLKGTPGGPSVLTSINSDCVGEDVEDVTEINCWFGPAGTVSPLHHDPKPNLLCQVFGYKYVRTYHPSLTPKLHPYSSDQLLSSNTSPIDVENPNVEIYHDFLTAPYEECILEPGQALYLPPTYWHFVKSLTPSFSINFWWQ